MSANRLELKERELEGTLVIDVVGELTTGGGHEILLEKVRGQLEAGQVWRPGDSDVST